MEIGKIDDRNTFVLHENIGKMILDAVRMYPDYPIAVLCGEETGGSDYYWMYCTDVGVEVGEILDCTSDWTDDELVTTDRDRFEEDVADRVYDILCDELGRTPTDDEQDEKIKEILAAHEPYWKKCITIRVDN